MKLTCAFLKWIVEICWVYRYVQPRPRDRIDKRPKMNTWNVLTFLNLRSRIIHSWRIWSTTSEFTFHSSFAYTYSSTQIGKGQKVNTWFEFLFVYDFKLNVLETKTSIEQFFGIYAFSRKSNKYGYPRTRSGSKNITNQTLPIFWQKFVCSSRRRYTLY